MGIKTSSSRLWATKMGVPTVCCSWWEAWQPASACLVETKHKAIIILPTPNRVTRLAHQPRDRPIWREIIVEKRMQRGLCLRTIFKCTKADMEEDKRWEVLLKSLQGQLLKSWWHPDLQGDLLGAELISLITRESFWKCRRITKHEEEMWAVSKN